MKTYSFITSEIEPKSLQSKCETILRSGKSRIELGRLYRYQGEESGIPVYRDIDGNHKPMSELTICKDDF